MNEQQTNAELADDSQIVHSQNHPLTAPQLHHPVINNREGPLCMYTIRQNNIKAALLFPVHRCTVNNRNIPIRNLPTKHNAKTNAHARVCANTHTHTHTQCNGHWHWMNQNLSPATLQSAAYLTTTRVMNFPWLCHNNDHCSSSGSMLTTLFFPQ